MPGKFRWNDASKNILIQLLDQGEVDEEDDAKTVFNRHCHRWPGLTLQNFRRHWNDIVKKRTEEAIETFETTMPVANPIGTPNGK